MAVLTPTYKSPLFELHGRVMQTLNVTVTGDSVTDEWVETDLGKIEAVVGWAFLGTTPTQTTAEAVQVPQFTLNAQGSAGSASLGALGIESATAVNFPSMSVTVIGTLG
jgi:hypothetical protein